MIMPFAEDEPGICLHPLHVVVEKSGLIIIENEEMNVGYQAP